MAVWLRPFPGDQTTPLLSSYAVLADDDEETQNPEDEVDDIIYEAGMAEFFSSSASDPEWISKVPHRSTFPSYKNNPDSRNFPFLSSCGCRECWA